MAGENRTLTANFVADTSGFSPKVDELIKELKRLSQDFEQNKSKVKELQSQLKGYETELQKLNSETKNGATADENQRKRMQELRDSIAKCNVEIGTYRADQTSLRSQINSTNRELNEQRDAFNGTASAATSFGDILKANLVSDTITSGLKKSVELLKQMASYCYNVGSSFEAAMSKVKAVSGATEGELEQLTAKAENLGATTRFTATQAAEAMNYMAMAGWDAGQMLSGIDGVISLAAASGTDLATTSDIVTDAISAFGLAAEDVEHFSNVLAAASANANTNVEMMGETFQYVAPIAGALGYSIDDVAEAIGLMANSGIKSSMAGTALRTMLSKLAEGATITGEAIGTVTISAANADGSMRDLNDVLSEMRENWALLSESEQVANADEIFGAYAKSGALALMNAQANDIENLRSAIENCDGAAASMADTMQDNVAGAVTQLNSALEGVGIAVYGKFKDGLLDAVNIFTDALSQMTESADSGMLGESFDDLGESVSKAAAEFAEFSTDALPGVVKSFSDMLNFLVTFRREIGGAVTAFIAFKSALSVASTIKTTVAAFKTLIVQIKAAKTTQEAFSAAMTTTPWGAVGAAIGLVAGAVIHLAATAETAEDRVKGLREATDEAAKSAEEYAEGSDELRKVKERYEEIEKSAENTADKEQALKNLQDELIAQYPDLAGKIDLVTGAYQQQIDTIQGVIDKQNEASRRQATVANNSMIAAEEAEARRTDHITTGYSSLGKVFDEVAKQYSNTKSTKQTNYQDYGFGLDVKGTSEEKYNVYKALVEMMEAEGLDKGATANEYAKAVKLLEEYEKAINDNKKIAEQYDQLVNGGYTAEDYAAGARYAEEWDRANSPYDDEDEEKTAERTEAKKKLSAEERKAIYDQEKQLADDQYSVGEISATKYYNKLKSLRDAYLDEGTHEWYQATSAMQSVYDKWTKAASTSASSVKSSLDEVQMAYKRTLEAIDAEFERHNREKSDAEFRAKIDEIDKELQYGRVDEFERYELEKQRKDLIDEHNEELYERQYADAKEVVEGVYNARQTLDKADAGTREYTLALGDYTDALSELSDVMRGVGQALGVQNNNTSSVNNVDESTKNNYVNVILQAVNKSNSQIVDELIKALKSDL